jgi:hypothetical protein
MRTREKVAVNTKKYEKYDYAGRVDDKKRPEDHSGHRREKADYSVIKVP